MHARRASDQDLPRPHVTKDPPTQTQRWPALTQSTMPSFVNKWTFFTPVMMGLELLRRRGLRSAIGTVHERLPLTPATRVLDVGCGIGTVLAQLKPYGCRLSGTDPTGAMLWMARRRLPEADLFQEPAHAMQSIGDASQDVTFVCSTLHGFDPDYRRQVYAELARVTRELVVVIDYHENHNLLVAVTEWVEGGDYFRFVKTVDDELAAAFPRMEVQRVDPWESLYLCWMRTP